uniref:Uncharacterized protein n=1 Tax=viral metagenome TaxID=1070528 RepID=A0A6M3LFG7_9ZZZZ
MREINLAGKYYKIHSDIVQRRLNPWKAKIGAGGLEYSDFSQAELEEYFDFRNGIGKKRGVGSDARQDWSEGIDFTNEGQAVLGPLVNSAGDFGVAPVKIIDFESKTYAIGDGKIAYSSADTPSWTTVWSTGIVISNCDDVWTTEQGANVTCGTSITKKEGTASALFAIADAVGQTSDLASIAIAETDFSSKSKVTFWVYSTVALNTNDMYLHLYDGAVKKIDVGIPAAAANTWTPCTVTVDLSTATAIDKVILYQQVDKGACTIYLDYIMAGDGLLATTPIDAIIATDATDSYLVVSSADEAIYSTDGTTWLGLTGCQGYLAFYDTKLRGIDTDGGTLHSSPANNIDGTWTEFDLTGAFGTVYDLFEGKLLADGTPTLYFCGTEGLFTIDTTNEIAYQQEVSYPPLTNAGNVGLYWNANVWVATGYGILKVAPSVATFLGPDQDDGLPATYQGKIYDFATVNNWLVFCVNGGSTDKSSILKRNSTLGGNQQVYTTSAVDKAIACIHHSPSSMYTNGRLWFGEGTYIKYMMFPDTTSNVKQIATYTYVDDSGYGKLPIFRKLAAISKTALGVAAITKSCDANEYVQVYYGLNGAAATTSLGTFKTSPKPTALTFASGLGTVFYTIQFAIKLYRGATTTNSPELESLLFYYIPTPVRISGWTFTIDASGDDGAETFTNFETIADTNTLVAFYPSGDVNKTSYSVKLTSMPSRNWWEEAGAREGQFTVTVEEVFRP